MGGRKKVSIFTSPLPWAPDITLFVALFTCTHQEEETPRSPDRRQTQHAPLVVFRRIHHKMVWFLR